MTRTTLMTGTAVAAALIQTTAKAHGVFNSPTDGTIKYVDPDREEAEYHSPRLTLAEAKEARQRGLIEDFDQKNDQVSAEERDTSLPIDENDLRLKGAERTEVFAGTSADNAPPADTLESRSSTAWPDRDRVEGGAEGPQSGAAPALQQAETIDADSGDDDAPPAPAPARGKSKPAADKNG